MISQFAIRHSLFAILIFVAAGCSYMSLPWSGTSVQTNATAEALYEEGLNAFNNKRYAIAIDRFQRVRSEFPFSPQVTSAELKLAEAYYLNRKYPEAVAAFKEFQALHPTNENIPFVIYHLGLSHFDQFTTTDREQKMTELAKGYFETVIKNHPNSPYAEKAREKLAKCVEYLAEHQFNIASFYFREGKYPAAIDRFEEILRRYKDAPAAPKSLYYLGESYRLDKNPLKAALAYEALLLHYPDDALAKQAEARLSAVSEQKADPLALLLKRDGRPSFAALSPPTAGSQQAAVSGQPTPQSGEIQNPKSKIENLNLVAKKEVVHEEPGSEKGFFRRVADTLNPFAYFSSERDEKTDGDGKMKADTAGRGESPKQTAGDPQVIGKIDESLKESGVAGSSETVAPRPPRSDLPRVEEPAPSHANPAELLREVDAQLAKTGKSRAELPPPPEAAPVFKASGKKPAGLESQQASQPSAATSGLLSGIDEALKRKGIDPGKIEPPTGSMEPTREAASVRREPLPQVEEEKGIFDKLREDLRGLGTILNPFGW